MMTWQSEKEILFPVLTLYWIYSIFSQNFITLGESVTLTEVITRWCVNYSLYIKKSLYRCYKCKYWKGTVLSVICYYFAFSKQLPLNKYQRNIRGESVLAAILLSRKEAGHCTSRFLSDFYKHDFQYRNIIKIYQEPDSV